MAQPRFDSVARSIRRLHGGFTLIELMVTVAVIAILAAIAVPIYTSYIERANVQEGLQKLSVSRTRMEQYFMDHRTYAKDGNACGFDPTTLTPSPAKEKFALKCDIKDAGGTTYEVVATGQGSMAGFTYTTNQLAVGTSTLTKSGWSTGGTVNCWVTRPGETC